VVNTPKFEGEETYTYCLNTYPSTITIYSGLIGTISDATFLWSNGETSPSIEVNEPGNYTLTVTRSKTINNEEYSCTSTRTFTVIPSETAQVTYELTGNIGNPILTVIAEGTGNYSYSLDNGPYQQSAVFENLSPGDHLLKVKDKNGCGISTITVYILGFPNFFTPNGDGYHDIWQIAGQDPDNPQLQRIEIYDRFSKLLYVLNQSSNSWNGSYNGTPMPSSDYWFKAIFKNGMTYRGHFTLKR
ncbi:MAG TPA: hypothetical protein DC015_03475, partial [Aequorivita sp.]|nr:hypothetical protein [Aequorivita sp.]